MCIYIYIGGRFLFGRCPGPSTRGGVNPNNPPVSDMSSIYSFPGANLLRPFFIGHTFTPPSAE